MTFLISDLKRQFDVVLKLEVVVFSPSETVINQEEFGRVARVSGVLFFHLKKTFLG